MAKFNKEYLKAGHKNGRHIGHQIFNQIVCNLPEMFSGYNNFWEKLTENDQPETTLAEIMRTKEYQHGRLQGINEAITKDFQAFRCFTKERLNTFHYRLQIEWHKVTEEYRVKLRDSLVDIKVQQIIDEKEKEK